MTHNDKKIVRNTLYLIIVFFIFRLIIATFTGLGTGEAYYFRGAYNVALSYFDQPPLFFWLSYCTMKIFGLNTFAIRLPSVLLFSGTSWIIFLLGRHFFNAKSGFYSVLTLNLSALYIIDGIWFQPDAPLLFFWAVGLYILSKLFFPKQTLTSHQIIKLWIMLGITMGLTGLSKYHVIFFFMGMALFMLTRQRSWFKHYGLYSALIICGLFFIPILLWNYQHDWASIRFQSSRALTDNFHLHFDWFGRSFIGQALWLLPWIWIPIVYELIRCVKLGKTQNQYCFFWCMAVFPIIFFTLATLWADLSYHFHWQSVGYLILFIPLGATIANKNIGTIKIWLITSAVIIYGLIIIAALQVQTGFWQHNGPKQCNIAANPNLAIDYKTDPTLDSYDYTDLYTYFITHNLFQQPHTFVGVSNWLLSGKIDWALKGHIDVRSFEEQRNYMYYFDDKEHLGDNIIFVTRDNQAKVIADTVNYCTDLQPLDTVQITRSHRVEMLLYLYTCKNFHTN